MKKILPFFIFLLPFFLFAQQDQWYEKMMQNSPNYYEVENLYNQFYQEKEKARGSGYKHFHRWAHWAMQDMDAQGMVPGVEARLAGYNQFKQTLESGKNSENTSRTNAGWSPLGPDHWTVTAGWNPGNGRVNEILVHPTDPNTIFLGTPQGGIWKTTNLGQTWTPLSDFLSSMGVSGIAIDPTNTETIYISTGDAFSSHSASTGVFKSTDGGETWEQTGLTWNVTEAIRMRKLTMHPTNPQILLATSSNGLFRTENGGDSWALVSSGNFFDVKFKHGDPSTVFAVTSSRFRISTDGGLSFANSHTGISTTGITRMAMAVTPAAPNNIYILAAAPDGTFEGFYKSTNGGSSFELTTNSPNILGYSLTGNDESGQGWYDLAVAVSPTNPDWIITGGIHNWISTNGGDSFINNTQWFWPTSQNYVHADIHYLGFHGGRLYCGNDGGISYSDNLGDTWIDISEGLEITQFYRMDSSPTELSMVAGGTQDNGCNIFMNDTWVHYMGADGMEVAIDPSNNDIFYGATQFGGIRRTTNGGSSFSQIKNNIQETGAWVTPYKIAPSSPNVLYIGYSNVWRTNNRGNSWTQLTNFNAASTQKIEQIAVFKGDEDIMVFSRGSALQRTTNGGESFQTINAGLPGATITYVEIHPTNPNVIYVTYGSFNEGNKVFATQNAGQTWIDITQNLPAIPVRTIALQEGSFGGIYIGTEFGIFYTDSTFSSYVPFMENLPNVRVTEFSLNYQHSKIRAATFGRGIWEADFFSMPEIAPIADFSAGNTVECIDGSITFTNQSLYGTSLLWEFEGGTPATSTDASPTIVYNTSGLFNVKLTVTNDFGSTELLKEDFVRILPEVGSALPFSEGFEDFDLLDNFFVDSTSDLWQISNLASYTGTNSLLFDNFNNNNSDIQSLFTGTFDFSELENPTLTFRYALAGVSGNPNGQVRLRIMGSTNCGINWSIRGSLSGAALRNDVVTDQFYIPQSPEEWKLYTLDNFPETDNPITNFATESVRLQFRFEPNFTANNLWIDDIMLNGTPITTFIKENNLDPFGVSFFPNPVRDLAQLNLNMPDFNPMSIHLYDVTGKKIKTFHNGPLSMGEHNLRLNFSGLQAGFYLLSLESEVATQTIKVILK
ncbi:MAG: VPS10 domain-containing protein [Luteibaculaceae bacterium]